ncbi:hypothetical protein SUGI_0705720 [Cryptomeria japonica]|uniref:F-box/kelch-repeat protein SKIP20-like n=1 Tax=Cryptomeria japonica TaxID=3369 RepID=UPI0024147B23|nr:F-box/kelch-repeat protein SKIP20-like [Cryptomeria japonica]GLJ35077.1 hypothetical protein SUGI_0705720 [Cryptomeria japonica]
MALEMFPGLVEDLGLQCLVRVPYKFHNHLRAVCKSWNAVLSSAHFCKERQRHNECEEGIAFLHKRPGDDLEHIIEAIVYYPLEHWWEKLPRIPKEFKLQYTHYHRCVYVSSKRLLVIMGLYNKSDNTEIVLIFDFSSRRWRLGPDVPSRRCSFACAASPSPEGLVYIGGGLNRAYEKGLSPHLVESYVLNLDQNKWYILPRMNADRPQVRCYGAFVDGKFYVVPDHGLSAQIYDPRTHLWRTINIQGRCPYVKEFDNHFIAVSGRFYRIAWKKGWVSVEEFDIANNTSTIIGRFVQMFSVHLCAVRWRDYIFVCAMDIDEYIADYYFFHVEKKRWTCVQMPRGFPTGCYIHELAAVQI